MSVYNNFKSTDSVKSEPLVTSIGGFDGIHLGHQKVIIDAKKKAKKNRLPFGLMTFEPVPVMFFNKKIKISTHLLFSTTRHQATSYSKCWIYLARFWDKEVVTDGAKRVFYSTHSNETAYSTIVVIQLLTYWIYW